MPGAGTPTRTQSKRNRSADFDTLKWIFSVSRQSLAGTIVILLIEMFVGASAGIQAILFRDLIDTAVARNVDGIIQSAIGLIVLVVAVMVLGAVNRYLKERLASTIENQFKHRVMNTVLSGDYAAVRSLHTGDWLTRITTDTSMVANMATSFIPSFGGTIARLVAAAIVLFSFDAMLGIFVLVAGIITILPSGAMRSKFKELQKSIQQANSASRVYMQEQLDSLLVVHSFAKEEQALDGTDRLLDEYRATRLKRMNVSNTFMLIRGFLTRGAYGVAALWCVYGIYTGTMTYGTLVAILQLVSQVQTPLSSVAAFIPNLYATIASAERLREVETLAPMHAAFMQEQPENVGDFTAIGFEDVGFSYDQVEQEARQRMANAREAADAHAETIERTTIRNLNVDVSQGSYTAFTGSSGSGKSTALKLFMCLYPIQEGMRYYESAQGRDDLENYARWLFAYVPQGNMLMSGTIREIVALYNESDMKEDERLWEALRISCADEFVRGLSAGLDTQLGEHGAGLSEGQMQRIAIARAVFSGRPVLLLDECTSALDEATEARLLANLRSMTDKTVLIVTHRPAALDIVDTVVQF